LRFPRQYQGGNGNAESDPSKGGEAHPLKAHNETACGFDVLFLQEASQRPGQRL